MGRFRDSVADDMDDTGVDMSPLIDCVFILLIFFIVTTVFVEETGVEVNKPEAASATQLEKTSILIALTVEGGVRFDDREIGVGGVRGVVRQKQQKANEEIPVIIQADAGSKTDLLIRIIDEAKLAGAKKISVATRAKSG